MITANIASHLPQMAEQQPDTLAVAIQKEQGESSVITYRELNQFSDDIARGLQDAGIRKGTRTVLMVQPGTEFFVLVFALFKIGAVLVAVDPGMGTKNLATCLAEAEPEAFIGIRKAQMARMLLGWARSTIRINIVVENHKCLGLFMRDFNDLKKRGQQSDSPAMNAVEDEDAAAILFTSGSTGVPKGVNYTHANFTAQVNALKTLYAIQPGEVDIATFPLFALFAPALGMTSVIPDMDFTRPGSVDAEKIFQAADEFKATSMFGSPALLDRVGRWGVLNGKKLPGLKRVLSAGAPVSAEIIGRFTHLLDQGVEIFTPYGATESLPVASIGSKSVLAETGVMSGEGKGVCVGKAVDSIDLKIIAISDDVIAELSDAEVLGANSIGEIIVKGPQVTRSYYNRDESTALAKIRAGADSFYHRMGDLAYLDESGRLWFCGRKSERVTGEKKTWYTTCCEGVFNMHKRVYRSALVGVKKDNETRPFLCIELEADSQHTDGEVLKQELLDMGMHVEETADIKDILIHPGFPVDIRHNAKIGRGQLAEWAQEQI